MIHLIGGTHREVEEIVEEAAGDREALTVLYSADTTREEIPLSRVAEETLVFYEEFGELPSDVQVTGAQRIKGQSSTGRPSSIRARNPAATSPSAMMI